LIQVKVPVIRHQFAGMVHDFPEFELSNC